MKNQVFRTSIALDKELLKSLKALAVEYGVRTNDLMTQAVREFLVKHGEKK